MSEKIIEEVMGLISDWSEKDFLWGSSQRSMAHHKLLKPSVP